MKKEEKNSMKSPFLCYKFITKKFKICSFPPVEDLNKDLKSDKINDWESTSKDSPNTTY